jgi:5'-3' exoribonuclease 2
MLLCLVRPKNLFHLAIDGVGPRAKINQQRARRFSSEKLFSSKNINELEEIAIFDTNSITPGTGFMHRLSIYLQHFIHQRKNTDIAWQRIKVILSDSNVTGEGEHKAMEFVRKQYGSPDWNPHSNHLVYGLDADLIFLALATQEPNFFILREEKLNNKYFFLSSKK